MEKAEVAVVGAGFAGMSAALYAARVGAQVTLFERAAAGGQILTAGRVENYPAGGMTDGAALAASLEEQVLAAGVDICREEVLGAGRSRDAVRLLLPNGERFCRALILAVGAKRRRLGVPGEDRFVGHGVSWCAACDGAFYRGQDVAVVGGGNAAFSEAIELASVCRSVTLLYRAAKPRAEQALQERAGRIANLKQEAQSRILEILGEKNVTGLRIERAGVQVVLPAAGIFEAVGTVPDTAAFSDFLPLAPDGGIVTDRECRTVLPGVFAVGDCRTGTFRQLVTAAADGAIAGNLAVKEFFL